MNLFRSSLLVFFILLVANLCAQNPSASDSLDSDVIIKALKDEVRRNMDQLQEDGYDKPFFIAYNISDIRLSYATAMLGSVITSNEGRNRNWYARVMVGGYDMSDENFKNSYEGYTFDPGYKPLPLDDDYWGIRRALWIATNNIYKSAARNYKQKQTVLKENDQDYLLPDFSKEKPVSYFKHTEFHLPKMQDLTGLATSISSEFKKYPDYLNSTAIIYQISAKNYFVNSEGSQMIKPLSYARVNIMVNKGKGFTQSNGQLTYFNTELAKLPDANTIKGDIDKLIGFIDEIDTLKEFKDEYSGPVLLEGQAVAEFFVANLLNSGKSGIIASREDMVNSNKQDIEKHFKELKELLDDKEEDKVAVSGLSVYAEPFLEEYEGVKLLGHFDIDGEGVIPDEKLALLKDGILITKLNDRVPAPGIERSNGHNRLFIANNDVTKAISPGVLRITLSGSVPMGDLLNEFEKEIKDEELEYGLSVKSVDLISSDQPVKIAKYDAENKPGEVIKAKTLSYNRKNALKKILAASDTYKAYNILWSGNSYGVSSGAFNGIPVSVIVPTAIVIKDYDFSSSNMEREEEKPSINGPLNDD